MPDVFFAPVFLAAAAALIESAFFVESAFLAESFGQLVLALTRARGQLLLFADPGTLVRRSACAGRIERLDEAASAREAAFAGELVRCLQGQTSHICNVVVEG